MKGIWNCPNCGKSLDFKSGNAVILCPHCREELTISPDKKIVLANPIRAYLPSDDSADPSTHLGFGMPDGVRPVLSAERKKKIVQLARERLADQEQMARTGLIYGLCAIVFGGALGGMGGIRQSDHNDLFGWISVSFGMIVLALGLFVVIWFVRSMQMARKDKQAIEKEMSAPLH